jgi:hypothetical protein
MFTEPAGAFYPLPEAAKLLGCSVQTLRRRIKAGALDARQVPTRWGPAWQVWLAEPIRVQDVEERDHGGEHGYGQALQASRAEGATPDQATLELVKLVRDLAERNARLERELATARAELRQRDARAPEDPQPVVRNVADSVVEGRQAAPQAEAVRQEVAVPAQPPRRPWWKFWE